MPHAPMYNLIPAIGWCIHSTFDSSGIDNGLEGIHLPACRSGPLSSRYRHKSLLLGYRFCWYSGWLRQFQTKIGK